MARTYYSQVDSRWKTHPYPANAAGYANKTIGSSGCGPTCAAMVVTSSGKEIIYPSTMGDIFRENGYRVAGGTSWDAFQYVADRWGLESKIVRSSYDALQAVKDGYMVIINVGAGLWTTGGHYIVAAEADGDRIGIYDPYLYNGKFNVYGRGGKVNLVGTCAWVQIDTFKQYSEARRFFCYKMPEVVAAPTQPTYEKIRYVNTQSSNLNVRNMPGGAVVGSLPRGTQVTVIAEQDGWSQIGESKWVSTSYLSDNPPFTTKEMYVTASVLNVRSGIGTFNSIVGKLSKNTKVTVYEERDGWSRIGDGQWVSSAYLSTSVQQTIKNTVGQVKSFRSATIVYKNSNLSGTQYNYKANTSVTILANISSTVDKVKVRATGRVGYVNVNSYK